MTWTSPPTVATGDIYTAAMFNTYTRDNPNHLRALTGNGDPTAASQTLVSSGVGGPVAWGTVPDAAMANQKVNQVPINHNPGGTFAGVLSDWSGFIQVANPGGVSDGPVVGEADWYLIQDRYPNAGIDYRLQIACYILDQNHLYMRLIIAGVAGSWVKIWHAGNDGSGSGLDADVVRGLTPGNANGNIPISNGTLNANLNAQYLFGVSLGNATLSVPYSNGVLNTSLNADMVDGLHAGNASGNVPVSNGTVNTNLNADKLDGLDWPTPIHLDATAGANLLSGLTWHTIVGLSSVVSRTGRYAVVIHLTTTNSGSIAASLDQWKARAQRTGSGTVNSREIMYTTGYDTAHSDIIGTTTISAVAGDTIAVQAIDTADNSGANVVDGATSWADLIWVGN